VAVVSKGNGKMLEEGEREVVKVEGKGGVGKWNGARVREEVRKQRKRKEKSEITWEREVRKKK
jgi:hypothetical protein